MPDWLVARLAAVYAAAGGALMASGGDALCDAGARRRASTDLHERWCDVFVRDEHWALLVLMPAALATLVVLFLPARGQGRSYAWMLLALADVLFVCGGAGYDALRVSGG